MTRPQKPRRGIVILVVLSLLVLFVMMVVTFVIVSARYRLAAESISRQKLFGENYERVSDRVMYDLVRDPREDHVLSPLRGHCLLRDLYGFSIRGQVASSPPAPAPPMLLAGGTSGGQLLQFFASLPSPTQIDGTYNGQVLTFISGAARGVSTRIVEYRAIDPGTGVYSYRFRVLTSKGDGPTTVTPSATDAFVINGRPFSGAGFGYNPNFTVAGATYAEATRLTDEALKPNRIGESQAALQNFVTGGANESYDAADYQNMLLAAVSATKTWPSLHRPDLIAHWMARNPTSWDSLQNPNSVPANWTANTNPSYRDFRRRIVFRPMPWDYPNFTGSNPAFDGATRSAKQIEDAVVWGMVDLDGDGTRETPAYWDVDNDGDGIPDSIWIDPDLPVQSMPDGRLCKPLVAILCVDLDGRLNVNAHGNLAHTTATIAPTTVPLPRGVTSAALPRGQGVGPAEINLNYVIANAAEYLNLVRARYGTDQEPGAAGMDELAKRKYYAYPLNYFSGSLSAFFSPPDLRGEFSFGMDHRGQPFYEGIYSLAPPPGNFPNLLSANPYEFNLEKPSAADAPFAAVELERVLRATDLDAATLYSRLYSLVSTLRTNANARRMVTTHSFDVPVPGVLATDDALTPSPPNPALPLPRSILELLVERLRRNGITASPAQNVAVSTLLSRDLLMGLRLDINRPLGNGRDDAVSGVSNGVVDDYGEAFSGEQVLDAITGAALSPAMSFDHDNDGVTSSDADAYMARQHLARHLYVLAMLLKDDSYTYDANGDGASDAEETARAMAQWAINVVDFRDADSIMTPFEYDVNPFNGWQPMDGNPATDEGGERRLVWGCERPELLLGEALAFHDRRTEDLSTSGTIADPESDPVNDFDKRLRPRGSLFIEL